MPNRTRRIDQDPMHLLERTLLPVLLTTPALAQTGAGCVQPPLTSLANHEPFVAEFWFNLQIQFFDVSVTCPIAMSAIGTWTFDEGLGNPPTPNQVGATGVVQLFTCPTTRIGNEQSGPGGPWALSPSVGTVTVAAFPAESTIVFNPPVTLQPGSYGVALRYLPTTSGPNPGPLHALGSATLPPAVARDQFLTVQNDAFQFVPWTGPTVDSPNLRVHYTPAPTCAFAMPTAAGCYDRPATWFEDVTASAMPTDLQNLALAWHWLGTHYSVTAGTATLVPSPTPSLTLGPWGASTSNSWDDALSVPLTLPFAFPVPGVGSTNTITIGSNGYVFLAAENTSAYEYTGGIYGNLAAFRNGPPRIAAFWHDLDLTAGGSLHYDVDPANQYVRITWDQVPTRFAPNSTSTMQLTLHAGGDIDLVTGPLANAWMPDNAVMGYSPGGGAPLPAERDITASLPFLFGDDLAAPVLTLANRPVLGTTTAVVTSSVVNGTLLQVLAGGVAQPAAPIDLTLLGMPGCALAVTPIVLLAQTLLPNQTFAEPLAIPNDPLLQGAVLHFQAAPLSQGHNAAGLLLSNALCLRVGAQ